MANSASNNPQKDFEQIAKLIEESKNRAYSKVNAELVNLCFNVGKIVSEKVSLGVWGNSTVNDLAAYLKGKNPGLSNFTRRGLYKMKQFFEAYTNTEFRDLLYSSSMLNSRSKEITQIVPPAVAQFGEGKKSLPDLVIKLLSKISWSKHLEILSGAKSPEERLFYLLTSAKENLNKLELRRLIQTATFERVMLSGQTIASVKSKLPSGLFKDPYIFEFLDLPEAHSETDMEKALITNLKKFILEIGKGFTYMGSQYTLQVGNKDYRTDLLFYHRELRCLVLFELKMDEFAPEFLGKLNFYLEALDRDIKLPHENPSIGILLCKGRDTEVVEYAMARSTSPALIADYETKLIDKKMLASKLHQLAEQLSRDEPA